MNMQTVRENVRCQRL